MQLKATLPPKLSRPRPRSNPLEQCCAYGPTDLVGPYAVNMTSQAPLRDRVPASRAPVLPASGGELSWRAATLDDSDAIFDCLRAIEAVDHPNFVTPRQEFEEQLTRSYVDLARDSLLAIDEDGRVLAFGLTILSPSQDTLVRAFLEGGVRPEPRGRGIGRELFRWQQERALEQFAASDSVLPGWVMVWADARATGTGRLASRFGFREARYFLELRRDLSQPIEDRELEGFTIVPFEASMAEAVRLARNDAFRDHWGSQPSTEEEWEPIVSSEVFRPDLSCVALAENGDVAGFVLTIVNEEDFALQGFSSSYLDYVGVPRAYRKRGVAPALLTWALNAASASGLDMVVLDVDSDNPSGALGFYAGVGFVEANRSISFLREF